MLTVYHIVEAVDRKILAKELGIGDTAISNALRDGRFPAYWRDVLERLGGEQGIDPTAPEFKALFKIRRRTKRAGDAA